MFARESLPMNERNFSRDTFQAGKEQGLATTRNASDVIVSDDSRECGNESAMRRLRGIADSSQLLLEHRVVAVAAR